MYQPSGASGRRLLAHEVAHVVQQSSGKEPAIAAKSAHGVKIGAPDDMLEMEADREAAAFLNGEQVEKEEQKRQKAAAPIQRFIQRQFDDEDDDPVDDMFPIVVDGTALPNDRDILTRIVRDRIYRHGLDAGDILLRQLNNRLAAQNIFGAKTAEGGRAARQLINLIYTLQEVVDKEDDYTDHFLGDFALDAITVLYTTLQDSENRIKTETLRYGIEEKTITEYRTTYHTWYGEPIEHTSAVTHTEYNMDRDTASVKGLAAAAQILLGRRNQINSLISEQNSHTKTKCFKGDCWDYPDPEYGKYEPLIKEATQNYNLLFQSFKAQFPVLSGFGDLSKRADDLASLANGPSPEAAEAIAKEAGEKLGNIDKTRTGLNTPEGSIWKLSRMVNLTKSARGISDDSYEGKLIEHHIDDLSNGWVELALTVIGVAFALLAPVTGGLSLIVTAAISTGIAVEHIKQYEFESAAAGTDFDQARAITDEPSLFWVALDVVGAILDIAGGAGEALKALKIAKLAQARVVFEAFAPGVRAAKAAKTTEEFEAAIRTIREVSKDAEKGDQIALKVIETLNKQREAKGAAEVAFGATEAEANTLREAAESGKAALAKVGVLDEAADAVEEGVKISKYGGVWTCHSPCMLFRERYAAALIEQPGLKTELEEVENLAKQAAAHPDDKDLVRYAKRRARVMEAKLRVVPTPDRLAWLGQLKELQSLHPSLANLAPEAFERILSVRKSLDKATGQLLEELLNAGMATREAREAQAGVKAVEAAKKAESAIEFIPGYMLRDENGRLITDGILGYRDKDGVFRVVKVFEAKAGEDAAEKLLEESTRMSKAGWRDLRQYAADAVRDDLIEAGKMSAADVQKLERMTADQVRRAHPAEYKKMFNDLVAEEAGQARRTLERVAPGGDHPTNLYMIDDATPLKVTAGPVSTQMMGVVPANVDPADLIKGIKAQGLNVDIIKSQLTQDELRTIAQSIIDQAATKSL
jgi:hypothetical protein